MVQRLARRAEDREVPGSSPTQIINFDLLFYYTATTPQPYRNHTATMHAATTPQPRRNHIATTSVDSDKH